MRCSVALLAWLVLAPLAAQPLTWHPHAQSVTPGARARASMAYNAATQRCVMFGGSSLSVNALDDTWVWNGALWIDVSPAISPPARTYAGMAYDEVGMRVILFGGRSAAGAPLNDTWAWDGANWTQLTPANPPAARFGMPLAYDPVRQVIVGFGGNVQTVGTNNGSTARTYEFDGVDWSEVFPPNLPQQRWRAHMFFNEVRGLANLSRAPICGSGMVRCGRS